jgi:uncharacterized protein YaiI (UPF0178 family)
MQIWIDADACPAVIKDIVFRAAERLEISTTLVANRMLRTPPSRFIRAVQVPAGFDVADRHIVDQVEPGDLVITADIPLAAAVLERQAHALNPRGEMYSAANIAERLSMRNFLEELRGAACRPAARPPSARATGRPSAPPSTAFWPAAQADEPPDGEPSRPGTAVVDAIQLDLDGRVMDVEALREAVGQRDDEGIARVAGRHHQVRGEGHVGGAERPHVEIMHIDDARLGTQPGVHLDEVDALRDAVEGQVQDCRNRPQVPSTITTAIARLTSGSSQPQPNCR